MLRRLHPEQPESFAFTEANQRWAEAEITKYPENRQASAIIALLWRAQEQEGWLSRPAMEHVAGMLGMDYIRALEVATFYFMFQLQPVGSVAHVQVCGTTSCMICGAEDLIEVCREKIARRPHTVSEDGKFSWEEVECLGACSNAPMVQIGKDYYEDLSPERFAELLDAFDRGEVPTPGSQTGRFASEPAGGLTVLEDQGDDRPEHNASVALALQIGDTIKRIDGTEVPFSAPWQGEDDKHISAADERMAKSEARAAGISEEEAQELSKGWPHEFEPAPEPKTDGGRPTPTPDQAPGAEEAAAGSAAGSTDVPGATDGSGAETPSDVVGLGEAFRAADAPARKPPTLDAPPPGGGDELASLTGVERQLAEGLHRLGIYRFAQIAAWDAEEVVWVEDELDVARGRVRREGWIDQARARVDADKTETK